MLGGELHHLCAALGIVWRDENVHMVRHQAIRMYRTTKARGELTQVVEIREVVALLEKTVSLVMATLNDVQAHIGYYDARRSGHNAQNGSSGTAVDANLEK